MEAKIRNLHSVEPPKQALAGIGAPALALRGYDRLHLARLAAGRVSFAVPLEDDPVLWPYVVVHPLQGHAVVRLSEQDIEIGADVFLILSSRDTIELRAAPGSDLLVIRVPADTAAPHSHALSLAHGRPIRAEGGAARLVAHLLRDLADQVNEYIPQNPGQLAQHLVGLLALMCVEGLSGGSMPPPVLESAKEYIEFHLGDFDLTPRRVATVQNVSQRTLHRIFERSGLTVSGWIRVRRLEHCRVDLVDAAYADLSVSAVGARWGLWDPAHFSRLFKSAYGEPPSSYRAHHAHIVVGHLQGGLDEAFSQMESVGS